MLKVGEIVSPIGLHQLRSGCSVYDVAVVVQSDPLVLVSTGTDMRWESSINPENFHAVGVATDEQLTRCMSRLGG